MAREIIKVPNDFRYQILHALDLNNKVSSTIDLEIRQRPGPPIYIIPHGDLPPGTVSEVLEYTIKSNGFKLVKAHQYRLPDGTVKGEADPKAIYLDDIVVVSET